MRTFISRVASLVVASLIVCVTAPPAGADDTEIFFTQTTTNASANLMLIIDTSGSMHETATSTPQPYISTLTYNLSNASCQSGRVYYRTGGSATSTVAPTSCSGLSWFANTSSTNKCKQSLSPLEYGSGKTGRAGFYTDFFIRWGGTGSSRNWNPDLTVSNNPASVECFADAGIDGDLSASNPYPRPGPSSNSNGRWGGLSTNWWSSSNTGKEFVLWSPNYIAWARSPPPLVQTRMEVVKQAAISLLTTVTGMNVGLMRYDAEGDGGMVLASALPIDEGANRATLIAQVTAFVEAGNTPLSETLFEAYRYFAGGVVNYGNGSKICAASSGAVGQSASCIVPLTPLLSVPASRTPQTVNGANYDSPADASCQNNYIVFLTDGLPTSDTSSNTDINNLSTTDAACSNNGGCLSNLSAYMYGSDLRSTVDGSQNVKTYFIGFGEDFAGGLGASAFEYLQTAAQAGGGQAFQANDLPQLEAAFNSIIADVVKTDVTFTAPTVAVNAFNRTQTLNDLYVSVFQPKTTRHWPGNLKKYSIANGIIKDFNQADAVDPATGFFKKTARSIWSAGVDGADVTLGGASNVIPDPSTRNVYTYISNTTQPSSAVDLTLTSSTKVDTSNALLTNTVLGLGGVPGEPGREELIDWSRGMDTKDTDQDANDTEARHEMGDSIHAQPAIVIYGNNGDLNDAAVFMPTNDGYLHAVDVASGDELWSFVPQEFLPELKALFYNDTVSTHQYALDGDIRVLKYDVNGNGRVDPSSDDRVILFFGQGRGGSNYYAIDVTAKETPKFLWSIGPGVLTDVGQTWSPPTLARVTVSDKTQNSQKLVLIVGGGYDPVQDGAVYVPLDSVGNRIYMIDALKGTLLWSAGSALSNANLKLLRMAHSIPSSVAVMDTDQDGFADRMYVGDMAAQLWRFDITTGNTADTLVAGGVLASLGNHDALIPAAADARRFYNAPDVAAVRSRNRAPYMNIAIGSGYRGHPLNEQIQDRFYAIHDDKPFAKMTQTEYNNFTRITDADTDLQDITTDVNPALLTGVRGWKLKLNQPAWQGEKVLTSSSTFDNTIFFTSYIPTEGTSSSLCTSGASAVGQNRAYIVSLFDGSPVPRNDDGEVSEDGDDGDNGGDNNGDGQVDANDRFNELNQTGIAPEVSFLFPQQDSVTCLSGVEVLSACRNFNSRVKTYWRETGAN